MSDHPRKKQCSKDAPHLTSEEYKFVTELLNGSTVEQAGEAVGIKRRTAYEWKKKEHIALAIASGEKGRFKIVEEFQAERVRIVLPEVSDMIQRETPNAVKEMISIMYSGTKDDGVRFQAAKEIIRMSGILETQRVSQTSEASVASKGLTKEAADAIRSQILGIPLEPENTLDPQE